MSKIVWNVKNNNTEWLDSLYNELNKEHNTISKNLCQILCNRNIINYELAEEFFKPNLNKLHNPFLMKDMDKAVKRIIQAFDKKEKILLFGDYDVDGTTAVALMYRYLKDIYDERLIEFYIPNRYLEGYGLSKKGIDYAAENNYTLVIALDCGIRSIELIDYAQTLGIDFIVCDHHQPGNELPKAVAVLDAKRQDCEYPFKELCGCGVGFKLCCAINNTLNLDPGIPFKYIDLLTVAIGADIVSMTDENRILAFFGLQKINNNPSLGIKVLMDIAQLPIPANITDVVFMIAPRVNAAGRMDDARKAVLLFIEEDEEKAKSFASELNIDNQERKETDKQITIEALELLKDLEMYDYTSVVYKDDWHKGVLGIVASRLIEHKYKPTIVLTKNGDVLTGSARTVKGFNLYEALVQCKDLLTTFGGHFAAAGLSIKEENLNEFRKKFNEVVKNSITEESLTPSIDIDTEFAFKYINTGTYKIIQRMEPFGPDNTRPILMAKNVNAQKSYLVKDQHIKFYLEQDGIIFNGIGFSMKDKFELTQKPIDIAFTINENTWNGNTSLQLRVIDIREAS